MKSLILLIFLGCANLGKPDYSLYGANVYVHSRLTWLQEPNIDKRLGRIIRLSSEYWSDNPQKLQGWSIVIMDGTMSCSPDFRDKYAGCTDFRSKTIWVSTRNKSCLEELAIPHELGHLFVMDPFHEDPRFQGFSKLWPSLLKPYFSEDPESNFCQLSLSCSNSANIHHDYYKYFWNQAPGTWFIFR